MPARHEDAMRVSGNPPLDNYFGDGIDQDADDEHGKNAAVLLAYTNGHPGAKDLAGVALVAPIWPFLDGHVNKPVA